MAEYLLIPHIEGAGEIAMFTGAILGSSLGFLWFNTYPASVFMGDVGSLPLGAALGTVAVISKHELLLLLVGGVFVIEAVSVIFQVLSFKSRGKRIFLMAPIHHHFEMKGWEEPKVVVRLWIIAILLALLSLSTLKLRLMVSGGLQGRQGYDRGARPKRGRCRPSSGYGRGAGDGDGPEGRARTGAAVSQIDQARIRVRLRGSLRIRPGRGRLDRRQPGCAFPVRGTRPGSREGNQSDRRTRAGFDVPKRSHPGGDGNERQEYDGHVDRSVSQSERKTSFCRREPGNRDQRGGLEHLSITAIRVTSRAGSKPYDYLVVEVSSFQLETIETFHPWVASILNVTLDHMDRYNSVEEYVTAKARIFENQVTEDFALLNMDDDRVAGLRGRIKAHAVGFRRRPDTGAVRVEKETYLDGDRIMTTVRGTEEEICRRSDMRLIGLHNVDNVMAAVTYALLCRCDLDAIRRVLQLFPGLEHALEVVRERRGVRFVNDSKGTNVDATLKALEGIDQPIWLIAGGRDKGGDFSRLEAVIRQRVARSY